MAHGIKATPVEVAAIERLFHEDKTAHEIAEIVGLSPGTVRKWLRDLGLHRPLKQPARAYDAATRGAAFQLHAADLSTREIATELGIRAHATVARWISNAGLR